jgi:hypothetical protein
VARHTSPAPQSPQCTLEPHWSLTSPQALFCDAHVAGWQHVVPTHLSPPLHDPQLSVPPQPSYGDPQVAPRSAHVLGVQVPHWFALPSPPQVAGGVQVPQSRELAQPS